MSVIKKFSKRHKLFSQRDDPRLTAFQSRVYEAVRKIHKGSVATYGEIACMLRKPTCARAVGNALNRNIFFNVPCYRVVRCDGDIGRYAWGSSQKAALLRREGIKIVNDHIDLKLYGTRKYS